MDNLAETDSSFFETILNAVPTPVFAVDQDVRIITANAAGMQMLGQDPQLILQRHSGDVLHCIHAGGVAGGKCGKTAQCGECVIRNSVYRAYQGRKVIRQRTKMQVLSEDGEARDSYLVITTAPFQYGEKKMVLLTIEDISELLKALLPICAHCKKIRENQEYWRSIEGYLLQHHNIEFSHGICPQCARKYYPEIFSDDL